MQAAIARELSSASLQDGGFASQGYGMKTDHHSWQKDVLPGRFYALSDLVLRDPSGSIEMTPNHGKRPLGAFFHFDILSPIAPLVKAYPSHQDYADCLMAASGGGKGEMTKEAIDAVRRLVDNSPPYHSLMMGVYISALLSPPSASEYSQTTAMG